VDGEGKLRATFSDPGIEEMIVAIDEVLGKPNQKG
jgi:hypothetical protein